MSNRQVSGSDWASSLQALQCWLVSTTHGCAHLHGVCHRPLPEVRVDHDRAEEGLRGGRDAEAEQRHKGDAPLVEEEQAERKRQEAQAEVAHLKHQLSLAVKNKTKNATLHALAEVEAREQLLLAASLIVTDCGPLLLGYMIYWPKRESP